MTHTSDLGGTVSDGPDWGRGAGLLGVPWVSGWGMRTRDATSRQLHGPAGTSLQMASGLDF